MSALARELRELAAAYWRDADKLTDPDAHRLIAAAWHTAALKLEADVFDSIDDCTEVYATEDVSLDAILADLDLNNDCVNPGGHLWLERSPANMSCVHCGKPAMPVYRTREG